MVYKLQTYNLWKNMTAKRFEWGRAWIMLLLFFPILLLSSCSESNDLVEEFPDWQNANAKSWNSIYAQATQRIAAGDTKWKIFKNWSYEDNVHNDNTGYIVVHVLNEGTGKGSPLYTDSVLVHYKGRLIESASYPNGFEFDSSWGSATSPSTATPAKFAVGGVVDGFSTALQHMRVGDEWEVYMPWTLGYGTKKTGSIPAYSNLIFTIQLKDYFSPGTKRPPLGAKKYF